MSENKTTPKRWGPDACQRCGYDQPKCTCIGGYVAPQSTPRHRRVHRFAAFMRIAVALRLLGGKGAPGVGARLRRKQKIRAFLPLKGAMRWRREGVQHWRLT